MADVFTDNFNFILPEIGGSPDTWGNKLNQNFSDLDALVRRLLPVGMIVKWHGVVPPDGWALCDGTNGTPDLVDRFIVGAGGEYEVGDTGGEANVTLTAAQMPVHSHGASSASAGGHNHGGSTGGNGGHSHTGSIGNNTHSHGFQFRTTAGSDGTGHIGTTDGSLTQRGSSNAGANSAVQNNTHSHSISINSVSNHTHSIGTDGAHTHTVTIEDTGGGEAHENRPPYYALAYITLLPEG